MNWSLLSLVIGFPGDSVVKNLPANAGDAGDSGSMPGSGGFPRRKKWQPTPVFLPEESHGQRNLVGCSPRVHKESGMTEQLTYMHTSLVIPI